KALLARSGITADLTDDPAAVRALADAFRAWEPGGLAHAAGSPTTCVLDEEARQDSTDPPFSINDLLPGSGVRFGRALTLTAQLQDLPDSYLAQVPDTSTPDPDDTTLGSVANPDSYTPTVSFTFRPGDLFLSSGEFEQAFKVMESNRRLFDTSVALAQESRAFTSFRRSLGAFPRFLNALSVSGSFTRRPQLDGGSALPPELLQQDRTATTWGVKFDPFLFFSRLGARSASYAAAVGHGKLFGVDGADRGPDVCDPYELAQGSPDSAITKACLALLSEPKPGIAKWLPVVEFKSVDQFDFVRAGNQFLPTSENDLETLSLTLDLSRALALAKARETALTTFKAYRDFQARAPRIKRASTGEFEPITVRKGSFLHHRLEVEEESAALKWRAETEKGKKRICAFPGVQLTPDGVLLGTPQVEGEFIVTIAVSDGLKQETKQAFQIVVKPGFEAAIKDRLLARYLELAVHPEVIADDAWFEDLVRAWEELGGGPPAAPVATAAVRPPA
ncbi:MAG: hypothetical protein ACRD2T_12630, partial [Thermoanaerobaculia bacterium]